MNMHPFTQAARGLSALSVAASLAVPAGAQPTGNPKGSAPRPRSDSHKASTARTPTGGFGDSGKIVTDEATAKARTQTMRPPVNTGPAQVTGDQAPGRASSGTGAKGAGSTAKPAPE